MGIKAYHFAAALRHELCARNANFARENAYTHVPSYGEMPFTVHAPESNGKTHGNFYPASYRAILKRQKWAARLNKVHAQARSSLPRADRRWRELDSCTSSDALLMNVFCCPGVCPSPAVAGMAGTHLSDEPEFGYRPRVPLSKPNGTEGFDRTEVDMKLGPLLVESKLTESDFQIASRISGELSRP